MKKGKFRAFMAFITIVAFLMSQDFNTFRVLGSEILVDMSTSENENESVPLNLGGNNTIIFIDGATGNDENDGTTRDTAVKTFEKAKELATTYQTVDTILVLRQVRINGEISLEGTNAIIKRDESNLGYLFWIASSDNVTLSNIIIDGDGDNITSKCALINCEGKLTVNDGTVLENNNNKSHASNRGGAICGQRSNCVITLNGGLIQNNVANFGGGIYLTGNAKLIMNGGTIKNNSVFNGPGMDSYWNYAACGGGVCLYEGATFTMNNGLIQGNYAQEAGGGVTIGTIEASVYHNNIFMMNGGIIDGNTAGSSGGGIFVQAAYVGVKDLKSEATITAGYITNNVMNNEGVTNSAFGGGGIYVNGYDFNGFKNGHLYMTNVIISNNEAKLQGGGYASCPISNTIIYLKEGAALYGNKASSAKEIFIYSATIGFGAHGGNPKYFIADTMLGGIPYHWKYNDGTEVPLNKLNGTLLGEGVDLSLYTAEVGNENTQNLAKVFITGNYSATRGGGIGSNGDVTIGRKDVPVPETDCSIKKVWDDNNDEKGIRPESIEVELWRKIAGSNDEPIYIGYETIKPDANGDWSLKFTGLIKEDGMGNQYEYIIKERKVVGYVADITKDEVSGYTITNSYEPTVVSVEGKKIWEDYDDLVGHRPGSITIRLWKNGVEIDHKVVTDKDDWSWSFTNLPKYENDQLIEYTITEDPVKWYDTVIDGYNVTNYYNETPEPIPDTGDNYSYIFWIVLMGVSLTSMISLIMFQKRRNEN